jgi:hypothetical protein
MVYTYLIGPFEIFLPALSPTTPSTTTSRTGPPSNSLARPRQGEGGADNRVDVHWCLGRFCQLNVFRSKSEDRTKSAAQGELRENSPFSESASALAKPHLERGPPAGARYIFEWAKNARKSISGEFEGRGGILSSLPAVFLHGLYMLASCHEQQTTYKSDQMGPLRANIQLSAA